VAKTVVTNSYERVGQEFWIALWVVNGAAWIIRLKSKGLAKGVDIPERGFSQLFRVSLVWLCHILTGYQCKLTIDPVI
jgi:hypothetical protein